MSYYGEAQSTGADTKGGVGSSMEEVMSTSDLKPVIDPDECIACEACVGVCPTDALEMADDVAVLARPDDCEGCGDCEQECPSGAITMA